MNTKTAKGTARTFILIQVVVQARAAGEDYPYPVAMFVDAAPFQKKVSFVGFWLINLVTGMRHLCCIVKKDQMCMCGCRAWCTIFKVLDFSVGRLRQHRGPRTQHMTKTANLGLQVRPAT